MYFQWGSSSWDLEKNEGEISYLLYLNFAFLCELWSFNNSRNTCLCTLLLWMQFYLKGIVSGIWSVWRSPGAAKYLWEVDHEGSCFQWSHLLGSVAYLPAGYRSNLRTASLVWGLQCHLWFCLYKVRGVGSTSIRRSLAQLFWGTSFLSLTLFPFFPFHKAPTVTLQPLTLSHFEHLS